MREPERAEAWFYLGAAYGARVQWRVLRARAARRRARRQADQGGARAGAGPRPDPVRRALRHRPLQVPTPTSRRRRRSSCGSSCCCRAATRTEGLRDMLLARERGALLRGEADYQLHWIYFWYEEQPQRGLAVLQDLHARYPHNPLFAAAHCRGRGRVLPRSRRPALPRGRTCSPRPQAGRVHAAPLARARARLGCGRAAR